MEINDNNNNNNKEEVKHTVYICFDNTDSSVSSFIDYLRATFNRHGIYDESDLFSDLIRVLVVVFSRNYTFSVPENLVNHLNNKDLVVVSVIHGVTVSSVTQQIAVLEPWSRVLLESSVLRGHVLGDERSESQFMEEIGTDVFEKLYPTEEIGIDRRLVEIENLLCKQSWGLRTLGIFGEPGIGKTTLARAVFRRMSSGYDASCFIKDFHKEYSEKRLGPLSDEYLADTPMERFDLNHSASEPRYRRKRVLIALDDVRNAKDADSFLGGGFGPGSLIIIISRDNQVIDQFHVNEIYELQGLNQKDAMKLFTRCAFGKDVTEQNLLEVSMEEFKCANGNPLTIREQAIKRKTEHASLSIHDVRYINTKASFSSVQQQKDQAESKPKDQSTSSMGKLTKNIARTQFVRGKSTVSTPHQIQITNRLESLPNLNTKASSSLVQQQKDKAKTKPIDQSTSSTVKLTNSRARTQSVHGKSTTSTPRQTQLTNRFESLSDRLF